MKEMKDYQLGLYEKAMPSSLPLPYMLPAARDAGFDFLEMSIDESDARLARLDWTRDERGALITAMRQSDLHIRTICLSGHRKYPLGSHDEATRAHGVTIFRKAVELASELGVRLIQLAGYDVYYEQGDEDTRAWFIDNLRDCVRYAAACGVTCGFETMETPFMDTVEKAMRAVRAVDSPYLGVYPDLGNLTNASRIYGESVVNDLELGRGRIFAMHIKETEAGRYRDMRFGSGQVDFVTGIRKALALGVRLFVAECWDDGREDWETGIAEVGRFVRARIERAGA